MPSKIFMFELMREVGRLLLASLVSSPVWQRAQRRRPLESRGYFQRGMFHLGAREEMGAGSKIVYKVPRSTHPVLAPCPPLVAQLPEAPS